MKEQHEVFGEKTVCKRESNPLCAKWQESGVNRGSCEVMYVVELSGG